MDPKQELGHKDGQGEEQQDQVQEEHGKLMRVDEQEKIRRTSCKTAR
ncbi:MAG TPA: hypothetical protein VIP56_10700 [Nitrososphaeraceae archaeon]